jgi:predicted nucleotidyltransferase component of viral defense system
MAGFPIELNSAQEQQLVFMKAVVRECADLPLVLKGGTGLLFGYGLPRFSEDLDFDSVKKMRLETKIKSAALKTAATIADLRLKKDTDTARRYMVDFVRGGKELRLKIEISMRSKQIEDTEFRIIDGMKIYKVEQLISQKIHASEERAKVRDLFDLNFLLQKYTAAFSSEQILRLGAVAKEPSSLLKRYSEDHAEDHILQSQSLENLVMDFCVSLEALLPQKGGK